MIKCMTDFWQICEVSVLKALRGCECQFPHADVTYWNGNYYEELFPAGAIVAIDRNTTLTVRNKVINIPYGYMMVFRGDFRHAGSAYAVTNYRLHLHLGLYKNERSDNQVLPLSKKIKLNK